MNQTPEDTSHAGQGAAREDLSQLSKEELMRRMAEMKAAMEAAGLSPEAIAEEAERKAKAAAEQIFEKVSDRQWEEKLARLQETLRAQAAGVAQDTAKAFTRDDLLSGFKAALLIIKDTFLQDLLIKGTAHHDEDIDRLKEAFERDSASMSQDELAKHLAYLFVRIEELQRERDAWRAQRERERERKKTILQLISSMGSKIAVRFFVGANVYESAKIAVNAWANWLANDRSKNIPGDETKNLIAAIIARRFRIKYVAIFVSLLPILFIAFQTWLIINQNRLLTRANQLIERSNELVRVQNVLAESGRKAALVGELTSIFESIEEELREARRLDSKTEYKVSSFLTSRIIAISQAFQPYRYLDEKGELIARPRSPERGQLLMSLVQANINIDDIIRNAVFTGSSLKKCVLKNQKLAYLNISDGAVHNSVLNNVVFYKGDFNTTDFYQTWITNTEFVNCNLEWTDFTECLIDTGCVFKDCIMNDIDIQQCYTTVPDLLKVFDAASVDSVSDFNAKEWEIVPIKFTDLPDRLQKDWDEFLEYSNRPLYRITKLKKAVGKDEAAATKP